MKCCNLAAFDSSHQARGVSGLSNASRLDRELWEDFQTDPEQTAFDAEKAYSEAMGTAPRVSDVVEWEEVQGLDRTQMTKVRVNQQFFRAMILTGYRSQCAICEIPVASLLVASHIVPWSVDRSLRMNPRNGLCLCNLHDRAFDRGLITINGDYRIVVDSSLQELRNIESIATSFLKYEAQALRLPERWLPDPAFLDVHANLAREQLSRCTS